EISALHRSGREFPISLIIFRVNQGDQTLFCALAQDLTQRIRFEQRRAAQYGITRALSESLTLEEAAPRILQTACETAGWDVGLMWIEDADTDMLRCIHLWEKPTIDFSEFSKLSKTLLFARGDGIPGRVWASGNACWIDNIGRTEPKVGPREEVALAHN